MVSDNKSLDSRSVKCLPFLSDCSVWPNFQFCGANPFQCNERMTDLNLLGLTQVCSFRSNADDSVSQLLFHSMFCIQENMVRTSALISPTRPRKQSSFSSERLSCITNYEIDCFISQCIDSVVLQLLERKL